VDAVTDYETALRMRQMGHCRAAIRATTDIDTLVGAVDTRAYRLWAENNPRERRALLDRIARGIRSTV
jgi:hypothetical protein